MARFTNDIFITATPSCGAHSLHQRGPLYFTSRQPSEQCESGSALSERASMHWAWPERVHVTAALAVGADNVTDIALQRHAQMLRRSAELISEPLCFVDRSQSPPQRCWQRPAMTV